MALTRADLENDVLRKSFVRLHRDLPALPDSEFNASLGAVLAALGPSAECWVFAYGSLIWNPLFRYVERRPATVHGFHRCFCLRSRMGRGTPERPGLVLGLDRGGRCHGIAFRIARAEAEHELTLLWRREMVLGSYSPRWVKVRASEEPLRALAFVVNRRHPHYAGKLPAETIVATLAEAHGKFGSGADYLLQTVDCLARNGIRDARLEALRERLLAAAAGRTGTSRRGCPETGA